MIPIGRDHSKNHNESMENMISFGRLHLQTGGSAVYLGNVGQHIVPGRNIMSSPENGQPPPIDVDRRNTMKTLGLGSLTALAGSMVTVGALGQSTFQPRRISPQSSQGMRGGARMSAGASSIPGDVPLGKLNGTQKEAVRLAISASALPDSTSITSVAPNAQALTSAARRLTLRDLDSLRRGNMDGAGLGELTTADLASIGHAWGGVREGGGDQAKMGCCCCCCFCAWCSGGSHGGTVSPK